MFAVYCRVSTTGQNLAGQRAEIDRCLSGNGIINPKLFKDKATGSVKASPQRAVELRAKGNTDNEITKAWDVSRRTVQRYLQANR